ncbi:DJ-1/PfpI family protein [Nocardia iowensis]|uniref:DJ-1/PfpI family protein n=1 Tax=Nocardia iowensis TaxID=204891 RepID=A0ABX8RGK3_NOCIO|nr:DJ-1/PfpI family protein [Nocardia iowensis]QXN88708.1 DJ-1/PfpI family protein [Nocardia iowensis]
MSDTATGRPKALIMISSARQVPLAEPAGTSFSSGFFLSEMGPLLQDFRRDHDFVFATPDGRPPQLDVNGLFLAGYATPDERAEVDAQAAAAQSAADFDAEALRRDNPELVARRDRELQTAYDLIGRITVSEILPGTEKEVASIRDEVAETFQKLPAQEWLSAKDLIDRDRDPADSFDLGEFAFVHLPGGHAPVVDFGDNPYLGELLNTLHDKGVVVSMICHGPLALVSTKYRVTDDGKVTTGGDRPLAGAHVTTLAKQLEQSSADASKGGYLAYLAIPGKHTRLIEYVEDRLREAEYQVDVPAVPTDPLAIYDEDRNLLTGDGPQAMAVQTAQLRTILAQTKAPKSANSPAP